MPNEKCSVAWSVALVTVLGLVLSTQPAQARTFKVIFNIGSEGDLAMDKAGNLYGTTTTGGPADCGTIFRLSQKGSGWILSTLYSFAGGSDGCYPMSGVTIGPDGGLYGATSSGGTSGTGCPYRGCGTVYSLRPQAKAPTSVLAPWTETVLHRFTGYTDGADPDLSNIVFDPAGNIYGTTPQGGFYDAGTVYELISSNGVWNLSVLHHFLNGNDGGDPSGGVILDEAGNLYGTTSVGGLYNGGTVFELTFSGSGWIENTLYAFQGGSDGDSSRGGLFLDNSGNLYGTTLYGGSGEGGTAFELTPSNGSWAHTVLYAFSHDSGSDGTPGPFGGLTIDTAGNLYGMTNGDGAYGCGSVFELTPSNGSWIYDNLHDFTGGSDGGYPFAKVILDAHGNVYGITDSPGVVFEITP